MYLLKRDDQEYPFAAILDLYLDKLGVAIAEEFCADSVKIKKYPKYIDWGDVETISCIIVEDDEEFEIEISVVRVVTY